MKFKVGDKVIDLEKENLGIGTIINITANAFNPIIVKYENDDESVIRSYTKSNNKSLEKVISYSEPFCNVVPEVIVLGVKLSDEEALNLLKLVKEKKNEVEKV